MPRHAVIFDAFGTLLKIQNGRHPYLLLLRLGQAYGRRPQPNDAHVLMQEPLTLAQAADRLNIKATQNELLYLETILAEEVAAIEAYSDGLEAVALLKKDGIRVGVCSNLAYPYREAILKHYSTLDAYVFSCELGVIKPAADIYQIACASLEVLPARTSMIGDSLRCDKEGPRAVGMNGFHLDRANGAGDYSELVSFAQNLLVAANT